MQFPRISIHISHVLASGYKYANLAGHVNRVLAGKFLVSFFGDFLKLFSPLFLALTDVGQITKEMHV
jgi:hypothetical protein